MKKIITIYGLLTGLIILTVNIKLQGQNFVPNPSFEEYTRCPKTLVQVYLAKPWLNYGNSPDYFNECSHASLAPPRNADFGYQYPHAGRAMAGIVTYVWQYAPDWPNYREYIGIKLTDPLHNRYRYYFSFFVNCAGYSPGWQIIATNKIGLRFSTKAYDSCCPPPLNNWAHLYTNSIISDTLNWIKLSGSFIADSSYQYLSIGNFFDDNHTDTLIFGGPPYGGSGSYYYIDDVCVTMDSIYNETWTGVVNRNNNKSNLKIFPNPLTNEYLNITNIINSVAEINVYDGVGRLVYNIIKTPIDNKVAINLNSIANGYYIISIKNKTIIFSSPLIINLK